VGRDVTERMLAEKSLRESKKNYEKLAKNANDAIAIIMGKDGHHVFVNKRMEEISGYTKADLLKIGFKELVPVNELEKITKRYFNRIAGKKVPNEYETNLVRKDGKIVPIEVSASKTVWQNQTAVLGIFRDISDRKKGEEEQKKVRDELERLLDERTSELVGAAEEMERKHNELLFNRSKLEKINQELLDTNKALTALARNIDREKEDAEKKVAKIVRLRMLPLLEDFQKNVSFKKYLAEIDELMLSLHGLTPGLKRSTDIILALAPTELRIATMIKNGLTSPAIANVLHISLDTVKSHRRNIRRKLKLNNTKINLASYLDAKM
jgi:PAS domain S-box-containing protein